MKKKIKKMAPNRKKRKAIQKSELETTPAILDDSLALKLKEIGIRCNLSGEHICKIEKVALLLHKPFPQT